MSRDEIAGGEAFAFLQIAQSNATPTTLPLRTVTGALKVAEAVNGDEAVTYNQLEERAQDNEGLIFTLARQTVKRVFPATDLDVDITTNISVLSLNNILRLFSTSHSDPITAVIGSDTDYAGAIDQIGNNTVIEVSVVHWGNNPITVAGAPGVTILYPASKPPVTSEQYQTLRFVRVDVNTWLLQP